MISSSYLSFSNEKYGGRKPWLTRRYKYLKKFLWGKEFVYTTVYVLYLKDYLALFPGSLYELRGPEQRSPRRLMRGQSVNLQ